MNIGTVWETNNEHWDCWGANNEHWDCRGDK